jgi:hypothetical protein
VLDSKSSRESECVRSKDKTLPLSVCLNVICDSMVCP